MKTTEFIPARKHMFFEKPCHGGKGSWYYNDMTEFIPKGLIKYIHDDILPPGSSFGAHDHAADTAITEEEFYICLSGKGMMILDGKEYPFAPGDVTVCRNGGSHGIYNNSSEDLRFLVICANTATE